MPDIPRRRRFGPPGGSFDPTDPAQFLKLVEGADELEARQAERDRRQQELARQIELYRSLIDKSLLRFSHASNLQGHLATGEEYAHTFLWRHNNLLQARNFGHALRDYGNAVTTDAQRAALEPAYRRANDRGGFLECYTDDMVRAWMRSPRRVFAYATGQPVDPHTLADQAVVLGGDVHLEIPEDDAAAELAVTLPHYRDNGDDLFDPQDNRVKGIIDEIAENHAIAGTVRDLAADDEHAHLGFASAARAYAFEYVQRLPRANPIKYMIAELFSISGVRLQDGREIRIQAPHSPITNIASMTVHLRSKRFPTVLGWRLRGKESPVYLDGDDAGKAPSKLLVDWHAMIHTL